MARFPRSFGNQLADLHVMDPISFCCVLLGCAQRASLSLTNNQTGRPIAPLRNPTVGVSISPSLYFPAYIELESSYYFLRHFSLEPSLQLLLLCSSFSPFLRHLPGWLPQGNAYASLWVDGFSERKRRFPLHRCMKGEPCNLYGLRCL